MTVVCTECSAVNRKGNKFCFECGARLPFKETPARPSKMEAKKVKLKKRWLRGDISSEEYRAKLLRLRLKEKFDHHPEGTDMSPDE